MENRIWNSWLASLLNKDQNAQKSPTTTLNRYYETSNVFRVEPLAKQRLFYKWRKKWKTRQPKVQKAKWLHLFHCSGNNLLKTGVYPEKKCALCFVLSIKTGSLFSLLSALIVLDQTEWKQNSGFLKYCQVKAHRIKPQALQDML